MRLQPLVFAGIFPLSTHNYALGNHLLSYRFVAFTKDADNEVKNRTRDNHRREVTSIAASAFATQASVTRS